MSRSICIANQKGGVGKTTTAINLSSAMAAAGERVVLVDMDPQCNATGGLGRKPVGKHPLLSDQPLRTAVQTTEIKRLDVLPGSRTFHDVVTLADADDATESRVVEHLREGLGVYDRVVIDCPPSLGPLTQTALAACHEILMPIQCEYFAMEGLAQMIEVIREVMRGRNSALEFGGILLTMYDPTLELTYEVDEQVRDFFGEIVFDTVVPRDVALSEAPSHGKSILEYSPRSRGCRAYVELCMEVLERE